MLNNLLYFLLFETFQPSYGSILGIFPESVITAPAFTQQSSYPVRKGDSIGPVIEAQSVFSIDATTGVPLYTRDIFSRRQIASITKLVTAMVILDNHTLDEKVTVSTNAATQEGSSMWLKSGEKMTVKNLLTGMLVNSGNDAAVALAEYNAGSEDAFVFRLNEKASQLGLKDTHFSNAKGFDEEDNYSTAFDTMTFSRAALTYPFIKKTVSIKTAEVASVDGGLRHKLESTNVLLGNEYFNVVGLKTGSTPAAGKSFVSLAKASNNHEILIVMLNSPNRFKETEIVLDWVIRNYIFP